MLHFIFCLQVKRKLQLWHQILWWNVLQLLWPGGKHILYKFLSSSLIDFDWQEKFISSILFCFAIHQSIIRKDNQWMKFVITVSLLRFYFNLWRLNNSNKIKHFDWSSNEILQLIVYFSSLLGLMSKENILK